MKTKKILPITISFLVVLVSVAVLIWLISIYNSQKTYKVMTFDSSASISGLVVESDGLGYLYDEYGGNFEASDLSVIPLSQFDGPDVDYSYYKFKSKYYGADSESKPFNGGNDSIRFLYEFDNILYLINTDDRTCRQISPDIDFHSASTDGMYLLEIINGKYNFYKRVNYAFDLYPPVSMNVDSDDDMEFITWLNGRYSLFKSETDKGFIYLIADAENGEALTCMSCHNSDEEYQKKLISNRYFVTDILDENILVFDIYTQETVEFEYSSEKEISIIAISKNATYAVLKDGENYKIITRGGKSLDFNTFTEVDYDHFEFIMDNVIFVSNTDSASVFKILL